jgi:hypothetical protein
MSVTITIGGKNYDAYVSVDQVDTYANGSLNAAAWEALLDDDRGRAIVSATRWIDSQCWQGEKSVADQPLEWPRVIDGVTVPASKYEAAAILLAVLTAANPELPDQMTGNVEASADGGTKRLKAGSVEIEYFRNLSFIVSGNGSVSPFPKSVMNLLGAFLCSALGAGLGNAGSSSYGTCKESVVGVRGRWGVNRGF